MRWGAGGKAPVEANGGAQVRSTARELEGAHATEAVTDRRDSGRVDVLVLDQPGECGVGAQPELFWIIDERAGDSRALH